jgi:glycosyltransferase involved in cell wall biosynthesis
MRISLVTTVRNEAASIDGLIESVGAQTRAPDEWIVVDGVSDDGTAERLARASACRVLVEPGNIAHGRNTAIRHTDGEIVAVTDGGCRPDRQWLARLAAPIERGDAAATAGRTRPRIRTPFDAAQWSLLDQFSARGLRKPAPSSRSLAFRRDLWEGCPYPEWLETGEDTWLFGAWRRRGVALVVIDDAVVEWQLRPSFGAFVRQHFRYMRGDGRASMHAHRHAMRVGFYGGLVGLAMLGTRTAPAACVAWLGYLAATAVRLPEVLAGRRWTFAAGALAILPPALLAMDAAKVAGYAVGCADRLRARAGG